MKKVYEETVVKTQMWEAIDGQRFPTQEECERYESSAGTILKGRFLKLIVFTQNAWDFLAGYDDHLIHAIKFSSQKDIDAFLHFYYYQNSYLLDDKYSERREHLEKKLIETKEKNDYFLVGENCEGELYIIKRMGEILETLKNLYDK